MIGRIARHDVWPSGGSGALWADLATPGCYHKRTMPDHHLSLGAHLLLWVFPLAVAALALITDRVRSRR